MLKNDNNIFIKESIYTKGEKHILVDGQIPYL